VARGVLVGAERRLYALSAVPRGHQRSQLWIRDALGERRQVQQHAQPWLIGRVVCWLPMADVFRTLDVTQELLAGGP